MSRKEPRIKNINPAIGLEGGIVSIDCEGFHMSSATNGHVRVNFGGVDGQVISASEERILARIPSGAKSGEVSLVLSGKPGPSYRFKLLEKLATELHPVSNPAVDRDGNIYTTFSGTRGEKVPFSLFKITTEGEKQPYPVEILNPTGLAFDREGHLYISSRYNGTIYRITKDHRLEEFADNLGIATGIALDPDGNLFVGDRNGSIYKVARKKKVTEFAKLEPSVSAYHLAFNQKGNLFVTGPTLATQDVIYEISPERQATVFLSGFGRPQGLAFDEHDNLFVCASYKGKKGIFKIDAGKRVTHFISSPVPVGIAFDDRGRLILADTESIYQGFVGIKGKLLI